MTSHLRRPLALLLLAALILSACGHVPANPRSTPKPPAATGTGGRTPSATPTSSLSIGIDPAALRGLHLQVWDAFTGSAGDIFTTQAAQFNTTNQWGIIVYPTAYGDYTTLFEAVNTGLGSGGTPDLVVALPEQALAWSASAAVVDLNPYITDPLWGLKSSEIADIPAAFWAQDSLGTRRLGVPAQRSAHFLFYNKTWAHELGFNAPPETADEFRQQACAANASFRKGSDPQKYGYGGWVVDPTWPTALAWMTAFGGGVLEGGAYRFSRAENLAALQYLKKLYDDHCAWLSTEPTPFDAFAQRLALFVSADLAEVELAGQAMARQKNNDEWTVLPFPGPQTSALVAYGPSYSLLASSPEKQLAAWLFVRWMLSPENQAQWAEKTHLFLLRTSAQDSLGDERATHPQWEAANGYLPLAQATPELASWRKVRYVLEDGTRSIFLTNLPTAKIQTVLTQMDAMAQELSK